MRKFAFILCFVLPYVLGFGNPKPKHVQQLVNFPKEKNFYYDYFPMFGGFPNKDNVYKFMTTFKPTVSFTTIEKMLTDRRPGDQSLRFRMWSTEICLNLAKLTSVQMSQIRILLIVMMSNIDMPI